MKEGDTFNKLTTSLSLDERKSLLSKLESHSVIAKEPLYEENEHSRVVEDIEVRFAKQPWYIRIWLYIVSLFKSKSPAKVFEDREVEKLGRLVAAKAPGFYNAPHGFLLPEFYEALNKLKESSRFFYSALESGFNRDKGAFYAFLGSLEMEDVHSRLFTGTDPNYIFEHNPEFSESFLRQTAQQTLESVTAGISEEKRNVMYADARALLCLKQLSSFLYDRLILAFTMNNEFGGMACSVAIVRDALISLNNILYSLKEIPSMTLLESLFVFILQEEGGGGKKDIDVEIQKLLTRAETAIATIRDFNRRVPLTLITRCAARDCSLNPKSLSGGEDWYLLYKEYWKHAIDSRFFAYFGNRRRRELERSYADFFKDTPLKSLENGESEENPAGFPVNRISSLCFLLTFHGAAFMAECNQLLRPLLIDGEFYKKENKIEFTENYNELIKLDDVIKKFDEAISPKGEWGKRYTQAKGEMTALPVKRRKIQLIQEEVDESAGEIVTRSHHALVSMVNILTGILGKDTSGRYDSLSNLSKLPGKGTEFIDGLSSILLKLDKAQRILQTIEELETAGDKQ